MKRIAFASSTAALLMTASSVIAQTVTVPSAGREVAPEFRQMAAKRAEERKKLEACHKEADEQKVLPRDKTKFLLACIER
jgi:hypothetical protein